MTSQPSAGDDRMVLRVGGRFAALFTSSAGASPTWPEPALQTYVLAGRAASFEFVVRLTFVANSRIVRPVSF